MIDRHLTISHTKFTEAVFAALQRLRRRYQTDPHLFTDRELAHLRFVRWLVHRPDWNRALDQPMNAQERQITPPPSGPWMRGLRRPMLPDTLWDLESLASPVRNHERAPVAPVRRRRTSVRMVGHVGLAFGVAAIWLMLLVATNFSGIVVALGLLIALAVLNY